MNPYGGYSIYMIDIFGSFEATLAAYYLGVLLVLTIGMQVNGMLDKLTQKLHFHLEGRETAKEEGAEGLSEGISIGVEPTIKSEEEKEE